MSTRCGRLTFVGSQGRNAKRVDIRLQQCAERIINHLMSLYPAAIGKSLRHDFDRKVPFAILGTGMASVQMTLVLYQQLGRCERAFELFTDFRFSRYAQGKTFLNGLTITRS